MEQLNYAVLKSSGYQGYILEDAPEKVLQFGEGNFLRAFTNYWFDVANEKANWNGKCVLVKPRGSFIFACTDYLCEGTPEANIRALAEAAIEYGKYE